MSPRSLGSSALLHAILVLLVIFGLPMLPQEDILYQPQVITVDLQIAPVANAPNSRPNPPKKPVETPPKPKPEPKKPEPKKPEEKKPEPQKEKPKPKEPEKKPEPKKEEPKKQEHKKEQPKKDEPKEPTLDDILNSLEKETPKKEKVEEAPAQKGQDITSDVPYDPSRPMSQSVKDSIRNQLMKCWNYQGGAKEQENLVAYIRVVFREDGSIIDAQLRPSDAMRYNSDPAFRSLVDSARRATKNKDCVPLKGLPVDSYTSWSKIELVFDPDEMW